jgi:plastocyanin
MPKRVRSSLPALVLLAGLTAGCGTGSDLGNQATAQGGTSTNPAIEVVMKSLAFNPTAISAKVGQRIVWTNQDQAPHNVTYVSGPRFSSSRQDMRNGARFSLTPTQPGTIHYFCTIHPWMKATIVVAR